MMDASMSSDGSELFGLSLGLGAFEELVAAGFGHDDIQGSFGPVSGGDNTTHTPSTSISTNGANAINGVGQAQHTSSGSISPQHNSSSGSRTPLDNALSRVSSHTDLQHLQQEHRHIQERRYSRKGPSESQSEHQYRINGNSHGQELEQLSVVGNMFGQDGQKRSAHGHEDQQQPTAQRQHQQQQHQQSSAQQARADQMNLEALQQLLAMQPMQNLPLLPTDNNSSSQQQSQQQQQQSSLQLGNLSLPNLPNFGNMSNMSSMQSSGSASPSTALLEQQIRLNQLQQLQQLQAQIFQQQVRQLTVIIFTSCFPLSHVCLLDNPGPCSVIYTSRLSSSVDRVPSRAARMSKLNSKDSCSENFKDCLRRVHIRIILSPT